MSGNYKLEVTTMYPHKFQLSLTADVYDQMERILQADGKTRNAFIREAILEKIHERRRNPLPELDLPEVKRKTNKGTTQVHRDKFFTKDKTSLSQNSPRS